MNMSDTEEIDKKKGEDTETEDSTNTKFVNFIKTLGGMVLVVIVYYSLGGLILFSCKVAQSNILPTDENCAPYTNQVPEIKSTTNFSMNIFKNAFLEPDSSEKISIKYTADNSKNKFLDGLRTYKSRSDGSSVGNYMVSVIEKVTAFVFNMVNIILSTINQLPESIIILLGPILWFCAGPFIMLFGVIYSIILWFKEMSWLFKTNTNESGDGPPKWESVSGIKDLSIAWFLVIVFFWIFVLLVVLPGFSVLVVMILIFVVVSILLTKATMNNKTVGGFSIVKDVFRYHKVTITIILTIFVILNAFGNLGTVPGVFSIATVALIYFGLVGINLYQPILQQNSTPIIPNDDQFIKLCMIPKKIKEKPSFFQSLFLGGGNAKKFVKDIKNIGQQMKK
jgi:hypothetical protein